MRTRVRVVLTAKKEVDIEVEHEVDEDPTDLTKADRIHAMEVAECEEPTDGWTVEEVYQIGNDDE